MVHKQKHKLITKEKTKLGDLWQELKKHKNQVSQQLKARKEKEQKKRIKEIVKISLIVFLAFFLSYALTKWLVFQPLGIGASPQGKILIFDPVELKQKIDQGRIDYSLIDLRTAKEYKQERIKGAANVPYQKDLKQWYKVYKKQGIKQEPIIVYLHFHNSVASREVVDYLRKKRVKAYYLGVGWNEWRHFRNLWLPEKDWNDFEEEKYVEPRSD